MPTCLTLGLVAVIGGLPSDRAPLDSGHLHAPTSGHGAAAENRAGSEMAIRELPLASLSLSVP